MKLYYTTTTGYNNEQPNPGRSLGGFKSSTPVVNDDFSNLFDEISLMTIRSGRDEYRAVILKNEFQQKVTQINVEIDRPDDSVCTYKMAIGGIIGKNKYGQAFIENVISQNNKPFRADFVEMDKDVRLSINDLEPGEEIGLWICRHIDEDAAKKQYMDVCMPDPNDPTGRRYIPVTHSMEESVNIIFRWDGDDGIVDAILLEYGDYIRLEE